MHTACEGVSRPLPHQGGEYARERKKSGNNRALAEWRGFKLKKGRKRGKAVVLVRKRLWWGKGAGPKVSVGPLRLG